jgi:hypothetical protein
MDLFQIILLIILLPIVLTVGFLGSLIKIGNYSTDKDHLEYLDYLEDK